jgi:hypothetical protein
LVFLRPAAILKDLLKVCVTDGNAAKQVALKSRLPDCFVVTTVPKGNVVRQAII